MFVIGRIAALRIFLTLLELSSLLPTGGCTANPAVPGIKHMASQATLKYVILYVDDVDQAVSFYTTVFGFAPGMRQGPYAEIATAGVTLALSQRDFVSKELGLAPGPKGAGSSEIGIVVPEADVQKVYKAALDAKATSVIAPKKQPWGQLVSYVRDLDGHLIEICSPND